MGIGIGIDSRRILISDKGPHDSPPVSDEKSEKTKKSGKERRRHHSSKVTEEKTREKGGEGETRPSWNVSWGIGGLGRSATQTVGDGDGWGGRRGPALYILTCSMAPLSSMARNRRADRRDGVVKMWRDDDGPKVSASIPPISGERW